MIVLGSLERGEEFGLFLPVRLAGLSGVALLHVADVLIQSKLGFRAS